MTPRQRWTSVLLAVAVLSSGGTVWAQATFIVSSTATTVVRTGHAEPVGGLTFSVVSGTTVAEVIPIDLSPAVLTSDAGVIPTSGVQATGFIAMVDPDAEQVQLHVPDGVGPGTLVHLEGLRISVPASGIETLDARISIIENRLTTGSHVTRVIAGVADAIVIDPSTDSVYTYTPGRVLIDHLGHFTFSEGFAAAFSDGTEIIFQASPLPRNTQIRFPATIESQTGASLTAAGGEEVILASGGVRNRVVYTFSSSASSRTAVDVFSFSPVLERTGPVGAGTGFYQVTIGPIGAAKPTRALPSTAVPRYEELLLPVLGPDLPTSKTFLFPVERSVDTQSFTVSNTATGAAPLTIRAFDEAGALLDGSRWGWRTLPAPGDPPDPDLRSGDHVRTGRDRRDGRVGGHRIQERTASRNEDRDHSGRCLRRGFPDAGGTGLFPVRPAQRRGDASRECGRCGARRISSPGGHSWTRAASSKRPPCGRPGPGVRGGVLWTPCSTSRLRRCRWRATSGWNR